VVRGRKGEYRKEIAEFQKKGFQRLKIDGEFFAIDETPALDKKLKHDIDVVVTASWCAPTSARGSPNRSRPRSTSPTASR
jgi:excinuclease UvrABC ATPase subunit